MQRIVRDSRLHFFLVGTEFFYTGGIQQINRSLVQAFLDFSQRIPATFHVFSYGDSVDSLPGEWKGRQELRWHGCARRQSSLAAAIFCEAIRVRPAGMLLTHVNLLPLVPSVRVLSRKTRIGLLGHGVEIWSRLPSRQRVMLSHLASAVAPSQFTAEQMISVNGMDARRVQVIPHTLPLGWDQPVPRPRRDDGSLQILTVARLTPADVYKGVDQVLRALPAVLQSHPRAYLSIAGDGGDRPRLEQIAQELGVAAHVRFLGRVPEADLRALYAQADVFVLPSRKEGFGLVFLEAMFHGTPVIAARAAGAVDVVEDGVTGLLVRGSSVPELAHAISGLLADPALRAALAQRAQARIQEQFIFRHFSQRWAAWLAALCPQPAYSAAQAAFLQPAATAPAPPLGS